MSVFQILGTRNPMGFAIFSGDISVHALCKMTHNKRACSRERAEQR
jgi:hypothetical protein